MEKERALQGILKKMLAAQEYKVEQLKDLIADHREKEVSTHEVVKRLRQLVDKEKRKIENHLDALKNIAEKVRGEELEKINRFTETFMSSD